MALQLATTIKGFFYDKSYWRRSHYQFDDTTNRGHFILKCYPSKEARDDNLGNALSETRAYQITEEMDKEQCYEHAKAFVEGDPPQPVQDEGGKYTIPEDKRVSFFKDAIDV